MPDTTISLYGEITKRDSKQHIVQGYISSEQVDLAGQIVDQSWLKGALPRWMQFGNIREQHRADKAVGRAKEVDTTSEPGPLLTAKIVDRDAWEKVEEGVYNGFSIGVKNPIIVKDAEAPRGRIIGGELIEVSIVDRPCNNESLFTLVKAVGPGEWKDCQSGVVVEDLTADLDKSRPKHSHPYVGTHNHTHVHVAYDGRTISHTHPHVHEDDDIHEHEHRTHPAVDSTTSGQMVPVLKEVALDNDKQKTVDTTVKTAVDTSVDTSVDTTVKAEVDTEVKAAVDTTVEVKAVEPEAANDGAPGEPVTKAAPDAVDGAGAPMARPGRFSSELTAIQEALSRLQALAGQTDQDKDGDIDFGGANSALDPDKTEEGEFQAQRPAPDAVLINPGAQTLSFSTMADLAKALLSDETFRTTLRSEIETVSGEVYTAKAVEVDAANQTSIDGLAEVSGNLVKSLGVVATQAETSAKGLEAVKSDLAKAAVEIERIKELAQPSKGISHVVEKGMLGAPDRFADLGKSADPAAMAVELSKMSEQDRIAFAAQGLKGIYGR